MSYKEQDKRNIVSGLGALFTGILCIGLVYGSIIANYFTSDDYLFFLFMTAIGIFCIIWAYTLIVKSTQFISLKKFIILMSISTILMVFGFVIGIIADNS